MRGSRRKAPQKVHTRDALVDEWGRPSPSRFCQRQCDPPELCCRVELRGDEKRGDGVRTSSSPRDTEAPRRHDSTPPPPPPPDTHTLLATEGWISNVAERLTSKNPIPGGFVLYRCQKAPETRPMSRTNTNAATGQYSNPCHVMEAAKAPTNTLSATGSRYDPRTL